MDRLEELVRRITGARVVTRGERIQSLWSGYGELVRMTLEGAALTSVVVKHAAPPAPSRRARASEGDDISRARKLRSYAVEMHWYERHARDCDQKCRVAQLLGGRHERDQWIFILEDLDATGFPRRARSPSPSEVRSVLRWLAAFHATFLGRKPEGLWSIGTYWHLGTRRNELPSIADAALRAAAPKFDAQLEAARFKTFVHGDAKIDNFCFAAKDSTPDGTTVAAVDFQYVGGGCGIKDIAYFFSSIWSPAECNAYADDALCYYFESLDSELSERRSDVDRAALREEWTRLYPFAWADFQRFLCGWASGQYDDDPYARRMIQQALAALAKL